MYDVLVAESTLSSLCQLVSSYHYGHSTPPKSLPTHRRWSPSSSNPVYLNTSRRYTVWPRLIVEHQYSVYCMASPKIHADSYAANISCVVIIPVDDASL